MIEFRTSGDGGNLWDEWQYDTLGIQGDYNKIVEYRALGMFNLPGLLAQIWVTAPVPFRLTGFYETNAKGRG
jgi:hypothetical protein